MKYKTLISPSDLLPHLEDHDWAVVDCRYSLSEPQKGRRDYLQAHIPGAVYAHLDEDLSGPMQRGVTGRHPLPDIEIIAEKFSNWGIGPGVQVVVYDDAGGAMVASRLWWLLRWLGHEDAAVLDGGWAGWLRAGYPVRGGIETHRRAVFIPHIHHELVVNSVEVLDHLGDPAYVLLDARSHDRYLGKNETIDPVAGHIPGAVSAAYAGNLTTEGKLQSTETLRRRYERLLAGRPGEKAIVYCGSGVTAAHDALAMEVAGIGMPRLYAGSWSEWITDPERPVEF